MESIHPNIYLLIKDIVQAQKVSNLFRSKGYQCYYFDDLNEFWQASLIDKPALAIVDVRLMSDGLLALREHPHVLSKRLFVAFAHDNIAGPLMDSTNDFLHLGLVNLSRNLNGEVFSLIKRLQLYMSMSEEKESYRNRVIQLEEKMTYQNDLNQNLRIQVQKHREIESKMKELDEWTQQNSLAQSLAHFFDSWDEIDSFMFFILSDDKSKLLTPKISARKMHEVPAVQLGRKCENGIEYFAVNMAHQMALGLMGTQCITLKIKGEGVNPDALIYIEVSEFARIQYPWKVIEDLISVRSMQATLLMKKGKEQLLRPAWDILARLEGEENNPKNPFKIIHLDFAHLVKLGSMDNVEVSLRELWGKVTLELQKAFPIHLSYFQIDPYGLYLFFEEADDLLFEEVKQVVEKIHYETFVGGDIWSMADLFPKLQMIPASNKALWSYILDNEDSSTLTNMNTVPKKKMYPNLLQETNI